MGVFPAVVCAVEVDGGVVFVAQEIEKVLAPVAKPLEIEAFPRPQVILVIGVNGSGKTTTIAKLAHWLKEQDYGGCRSQAFALTGSAGNTDPACSLSPLHDQIFKIAETEAAEGTNRYIYRNFSGGTLEPEPTDDA